MKSRTIGDAKYAGATTTTITGNDDSDAVDAEFEGPIYRAGHNRGRASGSNNDPQQSAAVGGDCDLVHAGSLRGIHHGNE